MMTAAAEVKPERTGWERNWATKPRRAAPMAIIRIPTMRAREAASEMYRSWSPAARDSSPEAVSSDTMATGPSASCRDRPKTV
jgi:hypothetical protein